jgi:hypothetical protein
MSANSSDNYFHVNDPIRDYFVGRTEEELIELSTFVKAISEEEMQDYLSRAFDVALEQIKFIGPRMFSAAPYFDATVKREMLDELFEKLKWKVSRQMILDDFFLSQG